MFTDERMQQDVLRLAARLPVGSGIVLRHDELPVRQRWRMMRRLMQMARQRRLMVMLAGDPALAKRWGADGVHLRHFMAGRAAQARDLGLAISMPVHNQREARVARRAGVDVVFVSPLYPTRSHQGEGGLGIAAWLRLARQARGAADEAARCVALGGMNAKRGRALQLKASGLKASGLGGPIGWAAIDAFDQGLRKARSERRT